MQTIRFSAALAASSALLAGFTVSSAWGQAPVAQPGAVGAPPRSTTAPPATGGLGMSGIGVVDVAYIFKTYQKFEQQMKMMKQKVEAAEAEVRKEHEAMQQMAEKMKTFGQGTQEYRQIEESLLRKQGDLNLKVSMQKKEFLEQEGKIYFTVSREIDDAVKLLASKHNILLVMRFAGDPVDPNDRNEILRGINKSIVYYHPQMDITPYVLQELQRGGGAGVSANQNFNSNVPVRRQ